MINWKSPLDRIRDNETPIKITGFLKNGGIKKFLLLPSKDKQTWQFVNISSGHICPCKFKSKNEALEDLEKNYSDKYESIFKALLD